MPELPEVEIVRQSLHKKIKKKSIKKVIIRNRNLRFKIPSDFESFLKNKKIIEVSRFSKYLIIHFQNEDYCLIHLGMSGTIHILDNKKCQKFIRLLIYLFKVSLNLFYLIWLIILMIKIIKIT